MEVIFVDDNVPYTEAVTDQEWPADPVRIEGIGDLAPRQIARQVAVEVGDSDAVVFINVNLKCEGKPRQEQAGVEVLKFLRLTERFDGSKNEAQGTHCVMYSFQSVEQLLRQRPSSLILCSDGVTFERLPCDLSGLEIRELAEEKASVDGLDKFLRGEFRLPDERHSWANWWGLKQLYDVHRLVVGQRDMSYPNFVKDKLTTLRATEGVSIYGHDQKDLEKYYNDHEQKISDIRDNISDRDKSILMIDDEYDKGWRDIIMKLTKYEDDNLITAEILKRKDVKEYGNEIINKLYENIKLTIKSENWNLDLILLDLRLFGEKGVQHEVEKLSGAKLLKKIRDNFRGVPVIVTTASNKAWSHEALRRVGADGYWIKEGIDERRSPEETVRNYLSLLELIETATGEKYQFLKRFGKAIESLKSEDNFWWEGRVWENNKLERKIHNGLGREEVFDFLDDSITLTRMHLREYEINSSGNIGTYRTLENMILWSITQHLGKLIEKVHSFDDLEGKFSSGKTIGGINRGEGWEECRGDWFGFRLYEYRNRASHIDRAPSVDWRTVKYFISNLICYLNFGPKEDFVPEDGKLPKIHKMRNIYPDTYGSKFDDIFLG